jgi:uncharacterized protein YbjT (DUF2867 family)
MPDDYSGNHKPNNRVLVAGATGGVGQLTVAKLLETGFTVRVLVRHAEKSQKMFNDRVEIVCRGYPRSHHVAPGN